MRSTKFPLLKSLAVHDLLHVSDELLPEGDATTSVVPRLVVFELVQLPPLFDDREMASEPEFTGT